MRDWSLLAIGLLIWTSLVGAVIAALKRVAPIDGAGWSPVVVGDALVWAGFGLRIWSIRSLGRFFKLDVVIQADHRVVDRGPYRMLRHPSYLGMILVAAGLGATTGDWASVAIMLMGSCGAFSIRIRIEERALLRALGEEYATYMQRTARLLPGIY